MRFDLRGKWKIELSDGRTKEDGFLPGSLDENKMGDPDKVAKAWHPDVEERNKDVDEIHKSDPRIATRLTRNYTYEGVATFTRIYEGTVRTDKRYFVYAERARAMSLFVDGKEAKCLKRGLSVPYIFEVTGLLKHGSELKIVTDNTYPGMPYRDITFSSAATDETQTNWNGVIGDICILEKEEAFLSDIRIYQEKETPSTCHIDIEIMHGGNFAKKAYIRIEGEALKTNREFCLELNNGEKTEVHLDNLELSESALSEKWDEEEGKLHQLSVSLISDEGKTCDQRNVTFGIRQFKSDRAGRLTLNDRRIFLRSETNCALFPETGHCPMDLESWIRIMETYASYGVNCVRFHSWCPPEAAFTAADRLGIMASPELPNWNPRDAFSSDESIAFYENEIREIVKTYANHPSFVTLTLGNELHSSEDGIKEMHRLMSIARKIDSTRLYAWGSNNFYGAKGTDEESDFYTSSNVGEDVLRLAVAGNNGIINTTDPCTTRNFDVQMENLRKEYDKPFLSFEVGQYEVLPDLHELEDFKGVTRPDNFMLVRDRIKEAGLSMEEYEKRVSASGELALLAYREEVEAVLRTLKMSGISLLGLQDFTGQGTALVGMLNSHLKPKSYAFSDAGRFRKFFSSQTILVLMDRYTYSATDTFRAEIRVANYGKNSLHGNYSFELGDYKGSVYKDIECEAGKLTSLGTVEIPFSDIIRPKRFDFKVSLLDKNGREMGIDTTYPVWVYPKVTPKRPEGIYETQKLDDKALEVLENGGIVYFTPPATKEAIPNSIQAQFTTDFWSVGTFPFQEGAMGQLINAKHPVFKCFPTEEYSNWQWFHMASQRAFILPDYMDTIVSVMDSYMTLRPMASLFEAKCLKGRILCSSMGLQDLQQYPEARALLDSIYHYLSSEEFRPAKEVTWDNLLIFS